jgi:hypothetical protein
LRRPNESRVKPFCETGFTLGTLFGSANIGTSYLRDALIDHLTETLLIDRGFDRDDLDLDIEWDGTNPDSQYSIVREDVAIVVDAIEQLLETDKPLWALVSKD